jgi:hypothetical protein
MDHHLSGGSHSISPLSGMTGKKHLFVTLFQSIRSGLSAQAFDSRTKNTHTKSLCQFLRVEHSIPKKAPPSKAVEK